MIGLKNFVLSTFAKNVPLKTKTSGGVIIWRGLFYSGEGITLPQNDVEAHRQHYVGGYQVMAPFWVLVSYGT